MATQLPPLPTDSNYAAGPDVGQADPRQQGGSNGMSPFSGGLPGMMQAIQQIEAGYKMLAQMLPSLTPIAAQAISQLRMAVPNAIGAAAGQGGQPPQGQPQVGAPGGASGLSAPPTGGQ